MERDFETACLERALEIQTARHENQENPTHVKVAPEEDNLRHFAVHLGVSMSDVAELKSIAHRAAPVILASIMAAGEIPCHGCVQASMLLSGIELGHILAVEQAKERIPS